MRIREPKTTTLISASGKMVCAGAKSEQQCKLAARKVKYLTMFSSPNLARSKKSVGVRSETSTMSSSESFIKLFWLADSLQDLHILHRRCSVM
ncbi:uncharacterized protein LOC119268450 isoform X2 [Triticum dicoccoides]|uniref:uncharacterized protein LOC119268450 isoform X2 n=1 Tax=Triticum dicoccoides TaxID=85692 RepID=UPI00188EE185|nr:uncharacterized protein LOC119268450 isoform X2 [Triticum dicoccoides]